MYFYQNHLFLLLSLQDKTPPQKQSPQPRIEFSEAIQSNESFLQCASSPVAHLSTFSYAHCKKDTIHFNTLKNHGYELTHNWGHVNGESFNFYILIMLAFYMHQILEMTDTLFQWCRSITRTYKQLWTDLEVCFRHFLFDSWEHMLCFYAEKREKPPPFTI